MKQAIYKDDNIISLIKKRKEIRDLLRRNKKISFDSKITFDNSTEIPIVILTFNILINENYTKESRKHSK